MWQLKVTEVFGSIIKYDSDTVNMMHLLTVNIKLVKCYFIGMLFHFRWWKIS